jgi:hypothetical protein
MKSEKGKMRDEIEKILSPEHYSELVFMIGRYNVKELNFMRKMICAGHYDDTLQFIMLFGTAREVLKETRLVNEDHLIQFIGNCRYRFPPSLKPQEKVKRSLWMYMGDWSKKLFREGIT